MNADILKRINITEQINAYVREQRLQEILGNKKVEQSNPQKKEIISKQ